MADFPDSPEGWAQRTDEFLDIAEVPANQGVFNVSSPDITDLRTANTVLEGLLSQRLALQTQLDGVNAQIKVQAPLVEAKTRAALKTATASNASAELKSEAGVTIPKPRVNSAPIIPTDLQAKTDGSEIVKLVWERAGNIPSAKFLVEKTVLGQWVLVDIVTATTLNVRVPVGEKTAFRVRARNGKGTSEPSNLAVVYDNPTA